MGPWSRQLSLLLAPVHPLDCEEGEGEPEGGDQVEQPLSHRACAKLGRANDAMDGHHQHVEQDETEEAKRIPSNVIRHCLETFAEVAAEFKLKNRCVKPISSINPFVPNENLPLFDHRDEDC